MPTVYRVKYFDSDSWKQETWNTDYPTEEEAKKMVQETYEKYGGRLTAPSYYIKAEYIGPINL